MQNLLGKKIILNLSSMAEPQSIVIFPWKLACNLDIRHVGEKYVFFI